MLSPATTEDAAATPEWIEIAPSRGFRALELAELWSYRELLLILASRDVKVRYRQTLLGALWVMGQPILTMLVFWFLFHRVAGLRAAPGVPYSLFVLSGLLVWGAFAAGVQNAGNSLVGSAHLISKVYFPRLVVPIAAVLVALADFAVSALLLVPLLAWQRIPPRPTLLLLPLVVALAAALALGVGAWLSALNVRYRDVRVAIPFLLQMWMYATPVVYPLEALPPVLRAASWLNPMTGVIEAFRACLLPSALPWPALLWSATAALLLLAGGAYVFRRMERTFADVL